MSLALIQGYSSAEEDEADPQLRFTDFSSDEDDGGGGGDEDEAALSKRRSLRPPAEPSPGGSLFPSALDAFSEIAGPPEFLNNCVEEHALARGDDQRRGWHGGRRKRKERKDLLSGAVVESKAQLVGIHDRVRSDIGVNPRSATAGQLHNDSMNAQQDAGRRVATATNPSAEDAAELLRICLQCGIPKTYSSARGMLCPVCRDRPPADPSKHQEKKGPTIKEKEKSKRMRGQSSHATWKSETEMQLRQQFD